MTRGDFLESPADGYYEATSRGDLTTDSMGVRLDGDAGGVFQLSLNRLYAKVTGDAVLDSTDMTIVRWQPVVHSIRPILTSPPRSSRPTNSRMPLS